MDFQQPEASQEAALWAAYHSTWSDEARDALVVFLEPGVERIAKALWARMPNIELDDLCQEGRIALVSVIPKFDIERGLPFWSYATPRVRGAMVDYLRNIDWVPRVTRRKQKTDDTLVVPQVTSLSQEIFTTDNCSSKVETYEYYLVDDKVPFSRMEFEDTIRHLMRGLTYREQLVLWYYYVEGLPLWRIGVKLGVSESRVFQMHKQAIEFLRLREGVNLGKKKRKEKISEGTP